MSHITRDKLRKRYGDDCHLCGEVMEFVDFNHVSTGIHPRAATIEHLIPASLGGNDTYDNLRLSHALCNNRKSNLAPEQWPEVWPSIDRLLVEKAQAAYEKQRLELKINVKLSPGQRDRLDFLRGDMHVKEYMNRWLAPLVR